MGLISGLIRALFLRGGMETMGRVGVEVADALRPNATQALQLDHDSFGATQAAYAAEFGQPRSGWFHALVNGLNRLPRPVLALSTPALFGYAMVDPAGFTLRMQGLAAVPEPLWWLLGAVVAFYFGARETHYRRAGRALDPQMRTELPPPPAESPSRQQPVRGNAALNDWLSISGGENRGQD